MPFHLHEFIHASIICSGLALNLTTIIVIFIKTSNDLKVSSCKIRMSHWISGIFHSFTQYFLHRTFVNNRQFPYSLSTFRWRDHSRQYLWRTVYDHFWWILYGYHLFRACQHDRFQFHNHSIVLVQVIARCSYYVQFWNHRKRVLQGNENLGKCRLQFVIVLLFIPHMFHIAYSVQAATPREYLEPIVDEFYGPNSTVPFGLHGDQ